jgi:hypothetical protein
MISDGITYKVWQGSCVRLFSRFFFFLFEREGTKKENIQVKKHCSLEMCAKTKRRLSIC